MPIEQPVKDGYGGIDGHTAPGEHRWIGGHTAPGEHRWIGGHTVPGEHIDRVGGTTGNHGDRCSRNHRANAPTVIP